MKVRELIEKLKEFDEDYEVRLSVFYHEDFGSLEIDERLETVPGCCHNIIVIKDKR